jgi:DNA-directed RNA polymerase subunit RPC12/RpoP
MSLKKLALWFLMASVAISAAFGIVAILTGDFGSFQLRIVLTTLTISATSICALASGALWESKGERILPTAGIVLALLAATLLVFGIWVEPSGDQFWKLTASVGVLAAATAHDCLLSLANLSARFTWARVVTFSAIYLLAFFVIAAIYIEPSGDLGFKIIGVTSIVVAALTIMTPIFHRLSRGDLSGKENRKRSFLDSINCPQCGARLTNQLTEIECDKCGCRFLLKVIAAGSA